MRIFVAAISMALSLGALGAPSIGAEVTGAGATFPYPLYAKWIAAYREATGLTVVYQPVGSGQGIKLIQQRAVTFGASDKPLKPEELNASGLIQFPTVIGGNVPVVNLPGVGAGQMVFDGRTLADLYLGNIKRWDDPAIRRLNPTLPLPQIPVTVVHRSDGSGTTFIWTDYLSKVSSEWKRRVGVGTEVEWPIGTGAPGNNGVGDAVAQSVGALGYVEFAYAMSKGLTYTRVVNRSGIAAVPSLASFAAAAEGADWDRASGFYLVLTDQPGRETWPIAGATFVLMHKTPNDPAASAAALRFFAWAYEHGDAAARELNYVPMPDAVSVKIQRSWGQIQGVSGP